jgi:hypothetical protein
MRVRRKQKSPGPGWEHKKYQEASQVEFLLGALVKESNQRRAERDRADHYKQCLAWLTSWVVHLEAKVPTESWAAYFDEQLARDREKAAAEGWSATLEAQLVRLAKQREARRASKK